MHRDIEISLRDMGGSSYYNVYVGSACFTIDFLFFKDSEYRVPKELERVVLQYCISFNTTLRTEHHGIHEVSILQDGQLKLSSESDHVPIPHYMPGDMNNPLIPINRDYNDGVINIRQWTSSAE